MRALIRSPFVAALLGGLVVAVLFLALGITGQRSKETVVQEAPVATPSASGASGLTPHEIYVRDAPGVVLVRAQLSSEAAQNPFDLSPRQAGSSSTGSGFLIDRQGHLLTNFHLVAGADRTGGITVQFQEDVSRHAAVVAQDPDDDLAMLKVDMTGVPTVQPLPLGDSASVHVGDPTLTIGNPFGLDRTLTSGIVSAMQRQIQAQSGFSIDNVIQTDAPLNPANSGGPLLDATGHVIGINSQIATGSSTARDPVAIAFAVPINTARSVLPASQRDGKTRAAHAGRF